jgi:hypothetical protein
MVSKIVMSLTMTCSREPFLMGTKYLTLKAGMAATFGVAPFELASSHFCLFQLPECSSARYFWID